MKARRTTFPLLLVLLGVAFSAQAQFSVDESTGEAHFDYSLGLPSARGRYQPTLSLSYTSSSESEVGYGFGWSLSGAWIEVTKDSIGALRSVYVESGIRKPILNAPARGGGMADVDDDPRHLTFNMTFCNTSSATDSAGTTYLFFGSGSADCTGIQYLSQVVDLDGNITKLQWAPFTAPEPAYPPPATEGLAATKVLSQITYNYYDAAGTSRSPVSTDPYATSVDLEYASGGRLSNVRISNAGVVTRRFELQYALVPKDETTNNMTYGLTSVTEHGGESGLSLPPTTFGYQVVTVLGPIVTPTGARYDVNYAVSSDDRWVVDSVTVSGPGLDAATTQYSYLGWNAPVTNWYDQTPEPIGYSTSYAWNKASNTVRVTSWETGSHAFRGVAKQIEWGPATNTASVSTFSPPGYTAYKRQVTEHSSVTLNGTCIPPTSPTTQSVAGNAQDSYSPSVPAHTLYPVITFGSRSRSETLVDNQEIASESTVACAAIDVYGNTVQEHIDPDLAKAGDDRYENATFLVAGTPTTNCKNCVATQTVTVDQQQTALLAATRYGYDATLHVNSIWRTTDPSVEIRVATLQYDPNGNLAAKTEGPDDEVFSSSFAYDTPYQLRLARAQSTQNAKTLTTDTTYDGFGRPVLVTGPYVGSPSNGAQVATRYDDLGRPTAIARQPITTSTISQAIAAFTYIDYNPAAPSSLPSVTSYTFATPVSYTDGALPQTSDVKQSTAFVDALGRTVQVRERMGGAGAGDPAAKIVQNLPNYRVHATIYDAAARVRAEIEPFYSSSGAFTDYRTAALDNLTANAGGLSTAAHAQLHSYDAFGREVCSAFAYVPAGGTIPPPPSSCQSILSEAASYLRATATCYSVTGAMLAVKTLGPELTEAGAPACSSAMRAPTSLFDASGTLYEADDIDGNKTQYAYDPLGNPTGIVRTTSDNASSIATSATWDMAGRLKHRSDPNAGAQDSTYFTSGRPKRLTLASHALPGGGSGSDYVDFTYDQGRLATRNVCTASSSGGAVGWTCAQDAYSYDVAQGGGTYSFVPGRMASAQNANATINFGYDANGSIVQRDEQLTGVPGQFSLATTRLSTGQPTASSFSSPYNDTLTYSTSYDSMLRPAQLSSGGTTYWNANSGSLGAYDPLGRVASTSADNGAVQSSWSYAAYSAMEGSAQVHLVSANHDLYHVSSETYRGTRLASFTDSVTGTNYAYTYTDGGRLRSAKVATGSTLNSLLCLSFNRNKNFTPGASFGNLERVRDQAPSTPAIDLYSYPGTDIASSGAGPDAPASIGPQQGTPTNTFGYDYAGRIISKSSGGESLTYDPLGRLTSVTRANAPGEVLTYDALGQLVGRLSGSTLTYYVGRTATLTTAKPSTCTVPGCALDTPTPPITVDVHVYAGARRIATVRGGTTTTGRILYYHRDRLGSVVATSTDGGVAGATYGYDVYGSMTVQAETPDTASELGFTGQLRLSGGLYVMGIRIYDAGLRQFLQPDVLNPMDYTYAGGDPINRIDPTGMVDTPSFQADHGDFGGSGSLDGSPCPADSSGRRTCGEEIHVKGDREHPTALGGHVSVSELPNRAAYERGGGGGGGARDKRLGRTQITRHIALRAPDYISLWLSVVVSPPILQSKISINLGLAVLVDKYGRVYVAFAGEGTGIGAAVGANLGWVNTPWDPSSTEAQALIEGRSLGVDAGALGLDFAMYDETYEVGVATGTPFVTASISNTSSIGTVLGLLSPIGNLNSDPSVPVLVGP